jgi:hypothetical protein
LAEPSDNPRQAVMICYSFRPHESLVSAGGRSWAGETERSDIGVSGRGRHTRPRGPRRCGPRRGRRAW